MKTRNILAFLLLLVAGVQTAAAQGFRVYKSDGTVAQFSFRTDSIVFYDGIGSDVDFGPFTPVNQCIVGTWYKTKSETITFNEDGTTNYLAGATYEFLPYQGTLIINNAEGKLMKLLRVPKVTKDYIVLSDWGGETFAFLTAEQPGQLVTGITINPPSLTLDVNETSALAVTVLPADADNKEVEWASSDEAVAVVGDFFGTITVMAKGYGTCTITATAKDGSGVKGECQVTVAQFVTGITLNKTALTLFVGSAQTLTATIQPAEAADKSIVWSSSKTSVATVDQTGKVTAKAVGTCVITASVEGCDVKAECTITVVKPVTGISLSPASLTLFVDSVQTLTATIQPSDATNKAITWKSNNTSIATVSTSGKVTAVAQGECTITATAKDGSCVKAECQITVVQPVTSIKLSPATLTLEVDKTQTLTATVLPSDATNKAVTWKSSNKSIATVSTSGEITAVASGECTITATAKDGSGVKGTCKVTVKLPTINGHEYVEIAGLKWATMNVGATTVAGSYETCFGDYFAWGETEPRYMTITRTSASEATFTWKNNYNKGYHYETYNFSSYTYHTLDAAHDAATTNWGSSWRMPKREDFMALAKECSGSDSYGEVFELSNVITGGGIYWLSSTQNIEPAYTGIAGLLFVSSSDFNKRIFFPASGCISGTKWINGGTYGFYNSSSLYMPNYEQCYELYFFESFLNPADYSTTKGRINGRTVRPVSD